MKYLAILAVLLLASHASAQDKPLPPREAPLRMTLPDGFKATLFAGEPDVVQPIAMCFDARGRLWVAECFSYPKWHTDLTQGRDRIVIFEDSDNDGVFDKRTVFRDKLYNLSGIQVGFGGVFLCATPHVLFIPDKNGDDVPDGPPEVILDGFTIKSGHNVMSSLTWGPDGWLYGCHGITATASIGKPGTPADKRVVMNCGVWRYHPVRKEVEAFAHGTTNPWGLDFDEHGQMFITNCVIGHLWHVVPGARFERMYGQDLNPHTYQLMKMCADHIHWGGGHWTSSRTGKGEHSDAGGGHAHVGCCIYQGDNFPDRYRNSVFMCNLHGNRINNDILERKGSTYVARHGKDFMFANDPWFRGIAMCTGPDGAMYVSDWTDTGECHNYKVVDQTNGRIFKIMYGKPKNPADTFGKGWDLAKLPDAKLAMVSQWNHWLSVTARRILQERAALQGKLDPKVHEYLHGLFEGVSDPSMKLNTMWTMHCIGTLDPKLLGRMMDAKDEHVRHWAIRLTMEEKKWPRDEQFSRMVNMARTGATPLVRLALASSLQRLPIEARDLLITPLASQDDDDPFLSLMIWYGVETCIADGQDEFRSRLARVGNSQIREYASRRIMALGEKSNAYTNLFELLGDIENPPLQRDWLRGIQEAMKGRRQIDMPKAWRGGYAKLIESPLPEVRDRAVALAVQFGDERAMGTLKKIVADRKEPVAKRQASLATLLFQQKADLVPILFELADDRAMRAAAIKGLAAFADVNTPTVILDRYPFLDDDEKADAVHTLTSRPAFARALLDAVAKKQVPRGDLSAYSARQIQALGDKELTEQLSKVWGAIRPASANKVALLAKYKKALTPGVLKKANLANGRALYQKTCAACHRLFDDGGAIGPEITGSQRMNLDYLLENMLDPSAVVARDYQVTVVTTTGGRVITGIVKQEMDKALVVQTQNELLVVPKGEIDSRTPSPQSMMPEGQLDPLRLDDVRDLVAYMQSPVQVPALAPAKKK